MNAADEPTLRLLRKALENDPGDWEGRIHVARLLYETDRRQEAADILRSGSGLPLKKAVAIALAELWLLIDLNEADRVTNEILQEEKSCVEAYRIKATISERKGDPAGVQKFTSIAEVIIESKAARDNDSSPTSDDVLYYEIGDEIPRDEEDDELEEPDSLSKKISFRELIKPRPKHSFAEIGGMDELKERIRLSIILPLLQPELAAKYGRRAGGGMLFYGPPGCGKTLLAKAAAGEANVPFFALEIPEVLSKWLGESEQRIHQFFENARSQAPAIVFLDEIDALGGKRSEMSAGLSTLVNVLLTEIDGSVSLNDGLLILGATNMPWRVDSAFRRPGRFDRLLFVPPPDEAARHAILHMLLSRLPHTSVDVNKLAQATAKFSGADLRFLVDQAAEAAMLEELKTGREKTTETKDLLALVRTMRPSTLEWLEQASSYASFANTSGLYNDLAAYLKQP
jgi:transitional endoplasmic reticulum ATPase